MATAVLGAIAKFICSEGLDSLKNQLNEFYGSKEINPQQARESLVKFVEASDERERYGLVKGYCEIIEDLYEKLRTTDFYVVMGEAKPLKGVQGHKYWQYLSGQFLMNHPWHNEKYDGHPEGKMFLRVHLHILLEAVGFQLQYREDVIEKHWGDLLTISRNYEYGQIWNMYFGYARPQRLQFFESHGGTLCGAVHWKWLTTVFNMYKEVVSLLQQQRKIKKAIVDYKNEYYLVTVFASGAGKQNIT